MTHPSGVTKCPSQLSEPVRRRLDMYAVAAGAAGVSILALSQSAQAKVIYTKTYHVIGKNSTYLLDLNLDGTSDFIIKNRFCPYGANSCTSSSWNLLTVAGVAGNAIEGTQHSQFWAADLKAGSRIPNQREFARTGMMVYQCKGVACAVTSGTHTSGNWHDVRDRYLAVRFQIHQETHYGWVRLSVKTAKSPVRATAILTGYAYETIPNKPIVAGQTKGPEEGSLDEANPATMNEPTLQPASLGLLAMGSPGLSVWRREESLVVAP